MSLASTQLVGDGGRVARVGLSGGLPPVLVRRSGSGDPGSERVLLLHGLANSGSVWDAYAEHGRRGGLETWVAELPWRGDSIAEWSARGDVVDFLGDALRAVPGGAGVVVAHSMAANCLLEFLNRALARGTDPFAEFGIRALVLVSPFYRRDAGEFTWETMASSVDGFARIMTEGIRVHSGSRLSAQAQRDLGERVRDRVGAYGWMRFFETYLATPRLRTERFTVPCLVVAGEHDFAAPPEEGRALAADLPRAEFRLLPECGHFLMIEQAERFAAAVGQFVSRTPSAARPPSDAGPRPPREHSPCPRQ
ncbi:alpha/beta fold hydrolase [Streptomyces fildesensis]|uniref:Alpha/beta fold hydrolase n=1 Tax=Streptomyces fildesensis TaxID=375757 RepID=A0ABW8C374_9ACTN